MRKITSILFALIVSLGFGQSSNFTSDGALSISFGGTGATTSANAKTNLGLVIGTNVQAHDVDLTTYAGITPSANVQTLLGSADFSAFKTSLTLNNVTNESKATMFASPTFTGTVSGVTATHVGLGNVTNESKATMFTNATLTGTVSVPAGSISEASLTSNQGGWTSLRVSGSNATTTGQTLVDITGLVSGTLTNATMYEIEVVLRVTTSAVTTGCSYGIFGGGSGGAATVHAILTGTTTTTAATSQTINAIETASSAMNTTSGATGLIIIKGYVTTRGSGTATIAIRHLKVTSGTSTVLIGSVFRYRIAN